MVKRINAFRIVFNFLLSLVELLIGVRFLIELFGSSESLSELSRIVHEILSGVGSVGLFAGVLVGNGLGNSVTALLLLLGFMLFSFILITILPAMASRKERELEFIDDD